MARYGHRQQVVAELLTHASRWVSEGHTQCTHVASWYAHMSRAGRGLRAAYGVYAFMQQACVPATHSNATHAASFPATACPSCVTDRQALMLTSKHCWMAYHSAFRHGHGAAGEAIMLRLQRVAAELDAADDRQAAAAPLAAPPLPLPAGAERRVSAEGAAGAAGAGATSWRWLGTGTSDAGSGGGIDDMQSGSVSGGSPSSSTTGGGSGTDRTAGCWQWLLYELSNQYFTGIDKLGAPMQGLQQPYGLELMLRAVARQLGPAPAAPAAAPAAPAAGASPFVTQAPWGAASEPAACAERQQQLQQQQQEWDAVLGCPGAAAAAAAPVAGAAAGRLALARLPEDKWEVKAWVERLAKFRAVAARLDEQEESGAGWVVAAAPHGA